jgi:hypothetical protein
LQWWCLPNMRQSSACVLVTTYEPQYNILTLLHFSCCFYPSFHQVVMEEEEEGMEGGTNAPPTQQPGATKAHPPLPPLPGTQPPGCAPSPPPAPPSSPLYALRRRSSERRQWHRARDPTCPHTPPSRGQRTRMLHCRGNSLPQGARGGGISRGGDTREEGRRCSETA